MKKNSSIKNILLSILGFLLMAAGVLLVKRNILTQDIIKNVPYLLVGIGAGVFGENFGKIISSSVMKNSPHIAKKAEIEEHDERNTEIRNKAKAKAYDLMIKVYGAVMIALALMGVDFSVVIAVVVAYLFVVASSIYYQSKFNKEM